MEWYILLFIVFMFYFYLLDCQNKKVDNNSFRIPPPSIIITKDIPLFYINLQENKSRNANIKALLNNLDFQNYTRVDAVNTKYDIDDYSNYIKKDEYENLLLNNQYKMRNYHSELTFGSIGCYISHTNIYKFIVSNNIPYAMIFEDDLNINCDESTFWNQIQNINIPNDADIFLLNAMTFDGVTRFQPVQKNINKIDFFWCLHCYVITLKGAKKILKNAFPISIQLDSYISRMEYNEEINVYVLNNKLLKIKQNNNFKTDLQNLICTKNIIHEINEYKMDRIQYESSIY